MSQIVIKHLLPKTIESIAVFELQVWSNYVIVGDFS